jgi:Ohr subfamily peroxiredoxin
MEKITKIYTATATTTGGRNGHVRSADGALDIEIRRPREMGGAGGTYANPEILFAGGYSACFDSALNLVMHNEKVVTGPTTVTAEVSIGKLESEGFGLEVKLTIEIPDINKELAESLVAKAHRICPYSNATKGNVQVTLVVI